MANIQASAKILQKNPVQTEKISHIESEAPVE